MSSSSSPSSATTRFSGRSGNAADNAPKVGAVDGRPPAGATNLVTCPVMPGNQVDPAWAEQRGLFRDYQGSRYWFCCAECGPLFDADPARYAHAA